MSILTNAQREQFIRDGYVAVSGLVPDDVISSTRGKICEAVNISLTDAATWPADERVASANRSTLRRLEVSVSPAAFRKIRR